MAAFERPDIAEGIFYEYLRYDDPISPEFRDRVVDGFPFLLGPLSRGLHSSTKTSSSQSKTPTGPGSGFFHALALFVDSCRSQTAEVIGHAGRSVRDAADHTGHAARSMGEAAVEVGRELDRRRDLLVKHTVAFSQTTGKVLMRDEDTLQALSRWISGEREKLEVEQDLSSVVLQDDPPMPRFLKIAYYAPDEIGPLQFQSSINRCVLALVHFYLLLLFIVSFPGSQYRIILRKTSSSVSHRHSRMGFDECGGDSSDEENNLPLSVPKSPNTQERLQCQQYLRHRPSRRDMDALKQKTLAYFI